MPWCGLRPLWGKTWKLGGYQPALVGPQAGGAGRSNPSLILSGVPLAPAPPSGSGKWTCRAGPGAYKPAQCGHCSRRVHQALARQQGWQQPEQTGPVDFPLLSWGRPSPWALCPALSVLSLWGPTLEGESYLPFYRQENCAQPWITQPAQSHRARG